MDSFAELMRDAPVGEVFERDAALDEVRRALFSNAAVPPRIGRYRILRKLGSGGQGVVYAAHDPALDRTVAIKILRVAAGGEALQRLRREANALAQLSHPNVVTIHDVGVFRSGVFIVMQLVAGTTLARWLAGSRPWRHVLAVFEGAGLGLAAAHAQGIVHRDFKPSNVWIGDDGVVRLLDFGLAGLAREGESISTPRGATSSQDRLTATNDVMGTPPYMAPEQHQGDPAAPATDQYAFCVALFEALYGTRPFHGSSLQSLVEAKLALARLVPPRNTRVPREVLRILRRGLDPRPAHRWPSMTSLLSALRDVTRSPVRRYVSLLGVMSAAAVGIAAWLGWRDPSSSCTEGRRLAHAWSSERRAEIETALGESSLPLAADMAARVPGHVDAFAARWRSARLAACAAVDEEPDGDRYIQCLDQLADDLDDRLDMLERATADVVVRSDELVRSLPDPSQCASALDDVRDPEADAAHRALAHARALGVAGHSRAGSETARQALAVAETTGNEALGAEAALVHGELLAQSGDVETAIPVLEDAYLRAGATGRDGIAFDAALRLVDVFASSRQDPARCSLWEQRAIAALARSSSAADPVAVGRLALARAKHSFSVGEYANALEHAREATERLDEAGDFRVTGALDTLAKLSSNLGRHDEALAIARRNVEVAERLRGPEHPAAAGALETLAYLEGSTGRTDAALEMLARVVAIRRDVYGDDDLRVAEALRNTATMHARAGHDEDAVAGYREVLAIQRRGLPADDTKVAQTMYNLSLPLRELGRIDEATALGREALRIAEASIGADHPTTAIYLHGLADTLRRTDPRAALDLLERGVESARNAFGDRHPVYAAFAASLGACHRALGDPARARILLDQSVAILEAPSVPVEPTELATALHERGLVLAALADPAAALADQERALAMMRQVRGDEHSSLAPMLRAIGDAQEAVPRP